MLNSNAVILFNIPAVGHLTRASLPAALIALSRAQLEGVCALQPRALGAPQRLSPRGSESKGFTHFLYRYQTFYISSKQMK